MYLLKIKKYSHKSMPILKKNQTVKRAKLLSKHKIFILKNIKKKQEKEHKEQRMLMTI